MPTLPHIEFVFRGEDTLVATTPLPTATPLNVPHSPELLRTFAEMIARAKAGRGESRSVRIAVVGGSRMLHVVAGTYVCCCKESPQNADALQAQFYLVPAGQIRFAAEFAKSDSWYRHHVLDALGHILSVNPPFPSSIDPPSDSPSPFSCTDDSGNSFSGADMPNPPSVVRWILEGFLRDARIKVQLPISLCQVWSIDGRFEASYPFFCECTVSPQDSKTSPTPARLTAFAISLVYHAVCDADKPARIESRRVAIAGVRQQWMPPYNLELATRPEDARRNKAAQSACEVHDCEFQLVPDDTSSEGPLAGNKPLYITVDRVPYGPFGKVRVIRTHVTFPLMKFLTPTREL
jgi:hypothetical protein